nr:hypothetical protein Itr_chr06CG12860 [Ipomoea trifida]GMD03729.1 hypothetical protein Iba_chr06aCG11660 [Ipomoea batatas]
MERLVWGVFLTYTIHKVHKVIVLPAYITTNRIFNFLSKTRNCCIAANGYYIAYCQRLRRGMSTMFPPQYSIFISRESCIN